MRIFISENMFEILQELQILLFIDEHIKIHKSWIKKSKIIFYESLNNQDPKLLLKFLKDWWMQHIQHEDIKYISYIEKILPH